MVSCQIMVVRGKASNSEAWGEFDFLALPSPGDRIMIEKDGAENYATVLSVHHYPVPSGEQQTPIAEVVAKWTGAGHKIR
jgi:hypothetical protein